MFRRVRRTIRLIERSIGRVSLSLLATIAVFAEAVPAIIAAAILIRRPCVSTEALVSAIALRGRSREAIVCGAVLSAEAIHGALLRRSFLAERTLRERRAALRKEVLIVPACRASDSRRHVIFHAAQALVIWNRRQPPCHETCRMKFSRIDPALELSYSVAKFIAPDRRDASSDAGIMIKSSKVREAMRPAEQRIKPPSKAATEAIMKPDKINETDSPYSKAPPWPEEVAGPARKPADISEAKTDAQTTAPTEERYIRR